MTWADVLKILFGTGLGFLISLGQSKLRSRSQKKRSEKLLLMELYTIRTSIKTLSGKNVLPDIELPSFKYIGVNELLSLSNAVAFHVYRLGDLLKGAERSRKFARNYLTDQSSREFKTHSELYTMCMEAASEAIDKIDEKLDTSTVILTGRS